MLLEIAQLPRSTYYYHSNRQNKEDKYAQAKAEIRAIYHENKGRYGYRRVTDELHNRGIMLNHKTVQRLMKELGLICRVRMKKYRSYKGDKGTTADNELNREFRAEKPNQKWVADVTEFRLFGEKLYLSPILDLYSGDIVTYTISDSPNLLMVTTMLEQAFQKIPDNTGLLLHSDQGWHYQHNPYKGNHAEVAVNRISKREYIGMYALSAVVTLSFYFILKKHFDKRAAGTSLGVPAVCIYCIK